VDFAEVARAFAADVTGRLSTGRENHGIEGGACRESLAMREELDKPPCEGAFAADAGRVQTRCEVTGIRTARDRIVLEHTGGETSARFAVFCAGVWADRLAVMAGADPDPRIVPFRGSYLRLRTEKAHLVRGLVYPVPDPRLPFLGVHLSRHVDGSVSLGPSALLAPTRLAHSLAWPGTWRMARRWWRTGARELAHAASTRRFAHEAASYVPELEPGDFTRWYSGTRAQAVSRDGRLVDDFVVSETERALHVRNAPSPAATSSLALARLIADRVETALG
jgi:(S)-2-hydroxyglutarate dehydrogenase